MTTGKRGPKDANKAATEAPDRRKAASSDTPPPLSLPHDVDHAWEDSGDRQSGSAVVKLDGTDSYGTRPLFTPTFTLMGSGPMGPSRLGRAGVFAPGSTFGVYLVGACIGEGGMARVYQAEHAGLRRHVALKVLIDGFARDLDGRERFLREARLAAAIKHPNVVNIFDVGVHDDIPYLVMEFLEGQDLEKLLESKGALDESLIIDVMIPVVAGLAAVHDAGIVHRDLKPGNIFLAKGRYNDLEPKLLDFGISKAQGPEQMKLTANRGVMGTPFYIPPEGLYGGEMTPLSDQYSLGVVMYECATGCTPYKASDFAELSRLITSGQYTPPTTHKPGLSKRLSRIIERAMSLQPHQRFKDAREMGRELLTLAGQRTRITWGLSFGDFKRDGAAPSAGGHEPGDGSGGESDDVPPPAQTPPRRKPVVPWVLGIAPVLVLLVGFVAWRAGMVSFGSGSRPATAPSATGSERQAREEPRAAPGIVVVPGTTAVAVESLPSAPPEPRGKTPSSGEHNEPVADPAGKDTTHNDRPARADSAQAAVRRTQHAPAAPAMRRPATPDTEDWALPSSGKSPGPSNIQVGPNDSPILD
jgi:eukaryotic-like serine/threonine-protein kinase